MSSEPGVWKRERIPQDTRVVLLFDLNGTLVSREGRKKKTINLRPGLHHLWRLKEFFRIGVFTSAMEANMLKIKKSIEDGASTDPKNESEKLFDHELLFCRLHTKYKERRGGKKWDTMKPLAPLFSDLSRVLLLDDDAYKAAAGEEKNMVLVPSWKNDSPKDDLIPHLVDILIEKLKHLIQGDVRKVTKSIHAEVAKRFTPPSALSPADRSSNWREKNVGMGLKADASMPRSRRRKGKVDKVEVGTSSDPPNGGKQEFVVVSMQGDDSIKVNLTVVSGESGKAEMQGNNVVKFSGKCGDGQVENNKRESVVSENRGIEKERTS